MTQFNQFKSLIDDYIIIFDQLILFETEKLESIAANKVDLLDSQMREEQAHLLKLKGLDRKREALQAEMNQAGLSFRQIIDTVEGEEKEVLESSFLSLSKKTEELQVATKSTKLYIELHLHSLDMLIASLGGDSISKSVYNKNGSSEVSRSSHFQSKKV